MRNRAFLTVTILLSCTGPALSGSAAAADGVAESRVFPSKIQLQGRDTRQRLLVSAVLGNGRLSDVTRDVDYTSDDPNIVTVTKSGLVRAVGSGKTLVMVSVGSRRLSVPVEVAHGEEHLPIDFTNDIAPLLSKRGCNSGGCHGKATGRGGFKLSLFGFEPAMDYTAIVRQAQGRRVFPPDAGRSLLLQKPLMQIGHAGGRRFHADEDDFLILKRWIAGNAPWGTDDAPRIVKLELEPSARVLGQQQQQQVLATALYSDGSRRDVTSWADFDSNERSIAAIDDDGLVTTQKRSGQTAIVARYQGQIAVSSLSIPLDLAESELPVFEVHNVIDRHVLDKLNALRVPASPVAADSTFLRRATLQIAGRLPTIEETRAFLKQTAADKRAQLVGRLLASPGYADYFAQKWSGLLRNKRRGQKDRIEGTKAFHGWIRKAISDNRPYDHLVRGVLTATGSVKENPPAQWYAEVRYLDRYVDDTAQVFLGLRLGCARCHHHPFENFSRGDYYGLAAFFGRVGRKGGKGGSERKSNETIFVDPKGVVKHPVTGQIVQPRGLGAEPVSLGEKDDPRQALVDWMTQPNNPYFARAFVNRMWAHFFGRGLVEPRDDMRTTNPAANGPLLTALAEEFVKHKYDMKHVIRLICTSNTYQLSSQPNDYNLDDTQAHSRFYPQRLQAEVLLDGIDAISGIATKYAGLPEGTRAVQLPDEGYSNKFLKLYGRPDRTSACECERETNASLPQSLFLMSDPFVTGKVFAKGGRAAKLAADTRSNEEKMTQLFLLALSRPPSEDEMQKAITYLNSEPDPATAWGNMVWVVLNMMEFLFVR